MLQLQSAIGTIALLGIAWIVSEDRRAVADPPVVRNALRDPPLASISRGSLEASLRCGPNLWLRRTHIVGRWRWAIQHHSREPLQLAAAAKIDQLVLKRIPHRVICATILRRQHSRL